MVLSSLAPLFILMLLRGNNLFPKLYPAVCVVLIFLPFAFLCWRIHTARRQADTRLLVAGQAEDHRHHILLYLFTTLLPFYREDIETYRGLLAMCVALCFIIYLFYRLNLHYLNLLIEMAGYRVFMVWPPNDENPHSGSEKFTLITRRKRLREGEQVIAFRLSDTVYLEKSK